MRNHVLIAALAVALLVPTPGRAQAIANVERALLPLQEGVLKSAEGVDPTLWESLAFLRAEEDRQRAIKGTVSFGLTGDEAGQRSLFKLNTGIALTRGVYPSEITVDSFLGLQLANGQLQEDVTSLKLSYDYHATRRVQYFAFAERFSDSFLSIQQRYEVGFGARLSFDVGRVGDWRETDRQFAALQENLPGVRRAVTTLGAPVQARLQATGVLDQARFDTTLDNLQQMVRDRQTRLVVGLAASVFAEIEHAALEVVSTPINGTAQTQGAIKSKIALDGSQRYRLNLRPTIRYRPSPQVLIRVYPYIKLPLDGPTHVTLADGTRRLDYRRDVQSEMTWTIRPEETGLEAVDLVFTFNHFFDSVSPRLPRSLVDEAAAAGREFDRLVAERAHRFVSMSLRVRW